MGWKNRLRFAWCAYLRGSWNPFIGTPRVPSTTLRFIAVRRPGGLAFYAFQPEYPTTTTVTRLANGSYRLEATVTFGEQ